MHPSETLPTLPCYLNGTLTTVDQARVSVLDRGFIFGDGVYEVVPVYGQRPFRFDDHMARLERSLNAVRIPPPMPAPQWRQVVLDLIAAHIDQQRASGHPDPMSQPRLVYLQVTRGVALRDHLMPADIAPTVFAMVSPMKPPSARDREAGVACVSAEDFRWHKGQIKSTSLLGAILARAISADAGAAETVLFRDGHLTEAAACNVWVVRDGAVCGPPRDHWVLEGIRYGLIESLCREADIPFQLRRIRRDEVLSADEILLSSATKEVLPVTRLDGRPVGHGAAAGRPGPVYARLYAGYQRLKDSAG